MSLWMMHWRPFTLSHISPLHLSTYTPGGVMKELHACFQWNTPEKGWIPSWIRVPWRIGEEEICCIYVSCLSYIPWASRSLDTYYYYIYHYRILPSTFAYSMNSMVSKAQSNFLRVINCITESCNFLVAEISYGCLMPVNSIWWQGCHAKSALDWSQLFSPCMITNNQQYRKTVEMLKHQRLWYHGAHVWIWSTPYIEYTWSILVEDILRTP